MITIEEQCRIRKLQRSGGYVVKPVPHKYACIYLGEAPPLLSMMFYTIKQAPGISFYQLRDIAMLSEYIVSNTIIRVAIKELTEMNLIYKYRKLYKYVV